MPAPPAATILQLGCMIREYRGKAIALADFGSASRTVFSLTPVVALPPWWRGTWLSPRWNLFKGSWPQVVLGSCINDALFAAQLGTWSEQFVYLGNALASTLKWNPEHMQPNVGDRQDLTDEACNELARIRSRRRTTFLLPSSWMDHASDERLKLQNNVHMRYLLDTAPQPLLVAA